MKRSISKDLYPDIGKWTQSQLKLAFYLYCQLPFGKLHRQNPEIIQLAKLIHRTPSSVAMKLCNFASLDPSITATGRKGLEGASQGDREVWTLFHNNWEQLATESEELLVAFYPDQLLKTEKEMDEWDDFALSSFHGETRKVLVNQRLKQSFFRRAVSASYQERCCMSGVSEPELLVASHIVPWSKDKANRLNPANGLYLSAIHDRAFDNGLITLSSDLRVILSKKLKQSRGDFLRNIFQAIEGKPIELPQRFAPNPEFLAYHRDVIFKDD